MTCCSSSNELQLQFDLVFGPFFASPEQTSCSYTNKQLRIFIIWSQNKPKTIRYVWNRQHCHRLDHIVLMEMSFPIQSSAWVRVCDTKMINVSSIKLLFKKNYYFNDNSFSAIYVFIFFRFLHRLTSKPKLLFCCLSTMSHFAQWYKSGSIFSRILLFNTYAENTVFFALCHNWRMWKWKSKKPTNSRLHVKMKRKKQQFSYRQRDKKLHK